MSIRCKINNNNDDIVIYPSLFSLYKSANYDEITELNLMDIGLNDATFVDYFPKNLKVLDISGNEELSYLPELPETLEELYMHNTDISNLPKLPISLKILDITDSPIERLESLPPNLVKLNENYSDELIKHINVLPLSFKFYNEESINDFIKSIAFKNLPDNFQHCLLDLHKRQLDDT